MQLNISVGNRKKTSGGWATSSYATWEGNLGFQDAHTWRMCVVHGNGKEALQHFDWISERTHTAKSYHYSLPSVSLQPSRLGWWRHVLLFYDDTQTGKGKTSAASLHANMIGIQNSIVWPNVKLALEFRSSKEWFCILGLVYAVRVKLVIWTMLGGRAFLKQYLRHTKISFFFHVTSIIGVQTNLTSSSEVPFRIAFSWMVG